MAWNEESISHLKKILREKRDEALKNGKKNKAMAFDIIDFLSKNSETKFTSFDLVAQFNLKGPHSLGNYLHKQTEVMKDLDFTHEEIHGRNTHAWFVDWEKGDEFSYWLSKEKSNMWERY